MQITIAKAKDITLSGKGYLVGIDNIYILKGSMFNFKYKKYAEKFVKMVLKQLKTNKNLFEVMQKEYDNYLNIESYQNQESILDRVRSEYFKINMLLNNCDQLITFAKNNIEKLNIENLDSYLYYCH